MENPSSQQLLAQLAVADRAATLDRLNREARLLERLVRKRQDGTIGQADSPATEQPAEDDMVSVGNTIHYYGGSPAAPPGAPPIGAAAEAPSPAAETAAVAEAPTALKTAAAGLSRLARVAIAAGLLGTGGGLASIPWALSALTKATPATVTAADKTIQTFELVTEH